MHTLILTLLALGALQTLLLIVGATIERARHAIGWAVGVAVVQVIVASWWVALLEV